MCQVLRTLFKRRSFMTLYFSWDAVGRRKLAACLTLGFPTSMHGDGVLPRENETARWSDHLFSMKSILSSDGNQEHIWFQIMLAASSSCAAQTKLTEEHTHTSTREREREREREAEVCAWDGEGLLVISSSAFYGVLFVLIFSVSCTISKSWSAGKKNNAKARRDR